MQVRRWRIVKVSGDGDCLFHALAYADGGDGQALRLELANYMEAFADGEAGFQEEMRREAAKLRAGTWGGHAAIATYSHMKQKRIVAHARRVYDGTATAVVEEMSHASVQGKEGVCMSRIFYNDDDHDDALVEVADLAGMEAAWPQPAPPCM